MAKRKPAAAESTSQRIERQMAAAALRKVQAGQVPNSQERAALKRLEQSQEEERRWQYYRTVPKKHYLELAGRQAKVVLEQAQRYGLPYPRQARARIDLSELLKWFHDFLAANKLRLGATDSDDPMLQDTPGVRSPALERYREERAKLARLERLEKEKTLLPRGEVHQALGRWAGLIQAATEDLHRQFGAEAGRIMTEALGDCQRVIDSAFATGGDPGDDDNTPARGDT